MTESLSARELWDRVVSREVDLLDEYSKLLVSGDSRARFVALDVAAVNTARQLLEVDLGMRLPMIGLPSGRTVFLNTPREEGTQNG